MVGRAVALLGRLDGCHSIEYRKDTPLQNSIAAGEGAQCIIFGMFGVDSALDGTITVNPKLPRWAPDASLMGLKLRGANIDIAAAGREFTVKVGNRVRIRGEEFLG